jgi:uncharacterized protein
MYTRKSFIILRYMNDYWLIIMACTGAVFAGFIDAVVGGGGLVQVPVLLLLFPHLSHVQVIATNRFASLAGTLVAAFQFSRVIAIDTSVVLIAGVAAAISSFGGTFAMGSIQPEIFKPLLLFIIVILTVFTFIKKDFGVKDQPEHRKKNSILILTAIGLLIGFYNGFIGPGTGVLLVFSFVSIAGMNFLKASAVSKIINAIADAASLVGFLIGKSIVFKLAIPMMLSNMLGGYIGSKTAILKGNNFVRFVFLLVIFILILRLSWDIWAHRQ